VWGCKTTKPYDPQGCGAWFGSNCSHSSKLSSYLTLDERPCLFCTPRFSRLGPPSLFGGFRNGKRSDRGFFLFFFFFPFPGRMLPADPINEGDVLILDQLPPFGSHALKQKTTVADAWCMPAPGCRSSKKGGMTCCKNQPSKPVRALARYIRGGPETEISALPPGPRFSRA